MNRAPRFCYAGTYERDYPRNRLTAGALRDAGVRVEEAHVPIWERLRDKSGLGPRQVARIALGLALAYGRLVPEVALRLLRCDALVVGYIGQVDMLLLGPVAKLMGRPVIFDPLVTLTDTIVEDRGLISAHSPLAWAIALIDRAALRMADVVLADTSENARYMTERIGVSADKIVVEPVGASEATFYESLRADWSDATDERPLDVLFYGKFIPLHGIETIIRAARIVGERSVPVRFELVGTGQTYREMRELAAGLNVSNITWTDWIPEDVLGDRLRRADVALGVFSGGAKAGRVVPNKVYQSLASRVATVTRESPTTSTTHIDDHDPVPPVIPTQGGISSLVRDLPRRRATRSLLRRDDRGNRVAPACISLAEDRSSLMHHGESALLVPPDDPVALGDAIERLCSGELRERIANGGRAAYEQHANAAARADVMGEVIERVMGSGWQRQPAHG